MWPQGPQGALPSRKDPIFTRGILDSGELRCVSSADYELLFLAFWDILKLLVFLSSASGDGVDCTCPEKGTIDVVVIAASLDVFHPPSAFSPFPNLVQEAG